MHDERYEDIILQAFPAEYERVRNASYEQQDFGLVNIWHMVHTMFVDSFRTLPTPSRLQAAVSPCRQPGTPTVACGASSAGASDTFCQTTPS